MPPSQSELIAQQTAEALAAGADPLGDNDPVEVVDDDGETIEQAETEETTEAAGKTETEAAAAATEAAAGADGKPAADAGKTADELSAEALANVAADEPPVALLNVDTTDFKAERAKLTTKEQEIEDKWTAGDLTDAERNKQMAGLRDERDELTRLQTRAETLADMNKQRQVEHQSRVLRTLADSSKKAGQLDYSDAKVGAAFDRMLHAVAGDPDNASKSYAEIAQMTHDALCAARGVKPAAAAAPAPAQAGAPVARKAPDAPITLRNLPAAATPNTGGDQLQAMAHLKGQAYQDAFNRLSPAQQAALVDG